MEYNKKEFTDWLRVNTTLQEGSISVYGRVIQTFFKEYDKLNLSNVQAFISAHNREANSVHVKAPFQHFFQFVGLPAEKYELLPKIKRMPRKRPGVYLSEEIMQQLIKALDKKIYRDVSVIRYYTGIRASEALTVKAENIRKKFFVYKDKDTKDRIKEKVIEISIIAKGNQEKKVYMKYSKAKKIFKPYMKQGAGFIFIPKTLGGIEQDNKELFWVKLQNQVHYYYRCFQRAAKSIGLNKRYGTHDLRRFFADWASNNYDLPVVQKMMGHARMDTTLRYLPDKSEDAIAAMLRH